MPLDAPYNTLQELSVGLKQKTTPIKFGYANAIGLSTAQLYLSKIGVEGAIPVSYRSQVDALAGLAQKEFDFLMTDVSAHLTQPRKAKPLALTTATRSPAAPELPSAKEAGLENFDLGHWWGVWLPAGASKDVVETINSWIDKGVASDDFRKFITGLGAEPWTDLKGDALRAFTATEIKKWGEAISLAKIEKE